jgi:biopolymer transport protein ExbD
MQFELPARPARRLVSLTPLIDVVFILLFFFMLASQLTRLHGLPLDTPEPGSGDRPVVPALLLRIHSDGSLDLNGEPISEAELGPRVRRRLQQAPQMRVLVQPDEPVPLQTTLRLFDVLAAAGVPALRLQ